MRRGNRPYLNILEFVVVVVDDDDVDDECFERVVQVVQDRRLADHLFNLCTIIPMKFKAVCVDIVLVYGSN